MNAHAGGASGVRTGTERFAGNADQARAFRRPSH
ncbi:hypothetical protein SAMN05421548_117108 [Paraburkholderia lycopersici]|uniref:Uncharacterized protein n=1 Tax=Paraburkholderia lycopersici TaxID=416944 RepID=A0A1G6TR03_9BURK|nr:hypothetical protein SAMN05421548_117108 [Paraburkholderia lycopersici]